MARATFAGSFTGQQVIDAVEAAAGKNFIRRDDYDDGSVVTVGQRSGLPYRNIIVRVDDSDNIRPEARYRVVSVESHNWGGLVCAMRYSEESVIEAVVSFNDKLMKILGSA